MRISDWSSDVCSSDLLFHRAAAAGHLPGGGDRAAGVRLRALDRVQGAALWRPGRRLAADDGGDPAAGRGAAGGAGPDRRFPRPAFGGIPAAAAVRGGVMATGRGMLGKREERWVG